MTTSTTMTGEEQQTVLLQLYLLRLNHDAVRPTAVDVWINQHKAMNDLYGFTHATGYAVSVITSCTFSDTTCFTIFCTTGAELKHVSALCTCFYCLRYIASQTASPPDPSWLAAVATMFRTTTESCQYRSNTVEVDPNNNNDGHIMVLLKSHGRILMLIKQ